MSDRGVTSVIIHDYLDHEKWLDSEEDRDDYKNTGGPKDGESEVAFFHRNSSD